MLTGAALKALKPQSKMYKVSDRDGMYVRAMPSGAISFRLDYRLNLPSTRNEEIEGDRSRKMKASNRPSGRYRAVACKSDGRPLLQPGPSALRPTCRSAQIVPYCRLEGTPVAVA
ncbi:Arm DNA-binding domain-containing protein [Xanthobacter sp. KR7-225]|uniref:Arm DNA-binding domain-containing protein n=1 Tax=Xanthobacter sp. KR7-225 TaxID=3156613 RepID=UPI0032B57956